MYRFTIAVIYFGLIGCNQPKLDHVTKGQDNSPADTSTVKTANHVAFETLFSTNKVTHMGSAINCIYQDNKNKYWFASNGDGVFCYDGKSLYQFAVKDGLCDNQVLSIQEDKQGNIWLVTVGGISRFDGKRFTTHPGNNDDYSISNKDFEVTGENLWFEAGGGAYHFNGNSFYYLQLPKPDLHSKYTNSTNPRKPDARKINAYSVYCSYKDREENIWLGTQTLGVCRYNGKDFTWFRNKGLEGPAVRALFQDSKGGYWFGNNGNGLIHYDGKNLTNFTDEKGLGNAEFVKTGKSKPGTLARVWSVNEDNSGNIWIATCDSGVWRYDGQNLTNYTTKDGLVSNAVNTIYKDKQGELWFGTDDAGVCVFNGTAFDGFVYAPK